MAGALTPVDVPVVCPAEQALEVVATKWTVQIIYLLRSQRVLRFSELQRALRTVTHKELTKQLRRLALHGLVSRHVFAEVPPRVEYALTPLGETLVGPLQALSEWAATFGAQVRANVASASTPLAVARA